MSVIDSYFQIYTVNEYTNFHLKLIFLAKKSGINLEHYLSSNFDPLQLEQIYLGLVYGVNVEKYADIRYTPDQMNEIRLGLFEGIDVDIYNSFEFPALAMKRYRKRLLKELSIQIRDTNRITTDVQTDNVVVDINYLDDRISELKQNLKDAHPLNYEDALNVDDNLDIFKFNY